MVLVEQVELGLPPRRRDGGQAESVPQEDDDVPGVGREGPLRRGQAQLQLLRAQLQPELGI